MEYFRARLPSPRWRPVLLPIRALTAIFTGLSRLLPTAAFGAHLVPAGRTRVPPLELSLALTREADIPERPPERDYSGPITLLSVGRIDSEKNPLLLVDALAELERRDPGRYRLVWVGSGDLDDAVREHAGALDVERLIDFRGYVPFGPELLGLYRDAHVFVHVSLTEGTPLVIFEALSVATAVVATDVGGVSAALDGGLRGALVPPRDRDALVAAVQGVSEDPERREARRAAGLVRAREVALEPQAERAARYLVTGAP
jgi:glycosyltransferase involved in cell wall biosynthesis